jgi:hypothetical protein
LRFVVCSLKPKKGSKAVRKKQKNSKKASKAPVVILVVVIMVAVGWLLSGKNNLKPVSPTQQTVMPVAMNHQPATASFNPNNNGGMGETVGQACPVRDNFARFQCLVLGHPDPEVSNDLVEIMKAQKLAAVFEDSAFQAKGDVARIHVDASFSVMPGKAMPDGRDMPMLKISPTRLLGDGVPFKFVQRRLRHEVVHVKGFLAGKTPVEFVYSRRDTPFVVDEPRAAHALWSETTAYSAECRFAQAISAIPMSPDDVCLAFQRGGEDAVAVWVANSYGTLWKDYVPFHDYMVALARNGGWRR